MTSNLTFRGLYTALITPFTPEGGIDEPAFQRLIASQIAAKVDGLVVLGTTAESPTLSHAEKLRLIELAVQHAKGKSQIVIGTGTNDTASSATLSREAAKLGADAVMAVTPYYNKPTPEGQYRHFVAIAEAAGLPTLLYNIKGRTAINTDVTTLLRCATHPLIKGVKEAAGDLDQFMNLRLQAPADFAVLAGDDSWALPTMAVGGAGLVSVIGNLRPAAMANIIRLAAGGDMVAAQRAHFALLPLMQAMFLETNPIPVKTAMAQEGLCAESFRLPMCPMQSATKARLLEILAKYPPAAISRAA